MLLAQEFGGAYPVEWNARTGAVLASPAFKALCGIAEDEGITSEVILSRVHADDRDRVAANQAALLQIAQEYEDEFRIVLPTGEERWILARGRSLTDERGQVVGLAGVNLDITARKQIEIALQRREAELRESEQRFRVLTDAMPQMVWSTLPDGYHDYYNARWYEFTGVAAGGADGDGWSELFHPEDRDRAWSKWKHSLQTGETYEIEYRLRHHSGEFRWALGRAVPLRDDRDRIVRWFGTCTDIDEAKRNAEQTELLSHELSHRIKNIFAVIQGLIGLSARRHPEATAFSQDLQKRIAALGRAHDFARPHGPDSRPIVGDTPLTAMLRTLLNPYIEMFPERIRFAGDDLAIDDRSATPIALIFHKLATNATKYGSLSIESGFVEIASSYDDKECKIERREENGPPVTSPKSTGFGTRLTTVSVENNLHGTIDREWLDHGLRVTIRCPIANLKRKVSPVSSD
ncbi:sensor histidine kinase [Sphingomonas beigongshangi]|uniref:sensor histidine kinase n=1 Tax=Sphingomonas beigongshangi TaxID=2782540 RepID=UPI001AED331D|nr:PAS domain-containing protein [Sphingomonas beigongshangi]